MTDPVNIREWRGMLVVEVPRPDYDGSQHCEGTEMFPLDSDLFDTAHEATEHAKRFYRIAAQVCEGCPFLTGCREYAIAHEGDGMWGGLTPKQRREVRRERGWMLTAPEEVSVRFRSQLDTEEEVA